MHRFIKWRDDWLLHIADLDRGNCELTALFNSIAERFGNMAPANGSADLLIGAEVYPVMERLEGHMRRHFSHEEALMREVKYPGYESHRHEHVTLLAEYTDLLRGVRRHGMGYLDLRVMAALKACIIGHIAVTDRKLGEHYHKRPWQAGTLPAQSLPAYR